MLHGPGVATGLGLQGLRHRIDRCGGDFSVRSKPKQGTRIDVRVPVTAASAGDRHARAGSPS
jgi:signal transduction histidine kinase